MISLEIAVKSKLVARKIRKIAVGPDYKTAMHFYVGQPTKFDGVEQGVVTDICVEGTGLDREVVVYHANLAKEKAVWKFWNYNTTPIHFENDCNFK